MTNFLESHPGGEAVILRLSGRDATEEFDPIHPRGTLEESLPSTACLGTIDPATRPVQKAVTTTIKNDIVPLDELLNLADVEKYGTSRISKAAWAYYWSASDDMISKKWNSDAYRSISVRPRVFIDVKTVDTTSYLLGHRFTLPVFVSPTAMCRLAHPLGEKGIASACGARGILQIISNNASQTPEEIVEASPAEQVFGWQLYVQTDAAKSEAMMRRINTLRHRIKFIVLTLDAPTPGKREEDDRQKRELMPIPLPNMSNTSRSPKGGFGKALFAGTSPSLAWTTTLPWLLKHTDLPIVLKGIQTHEDALLATRHAPQVRGIILSNHGGRACDTAPAPLQTLLEIQRHCPQVTEKLEVWIDGGVQRGTDVVKAIALGARGVGLGRAALWGLAAGGAEGVERVMESMYTMFTSVVSFEKMSYANDDGQSWQRRYRQP